MTDVSFAGRPITSLQTMLRTIAQVKSSQPSVVPDGVYGAQTMRAVSEFQRQNGMDSTGITDFETWQQIRDAYKDALVEVAQAAPLEITLDRLQVILPGSRNRHVYLIQAMLLALSLDYSELCDVRVTGIYDEATQKAVRWLQKCSGVTSSGILTKANWKLLVALYAQKIGNGEIEKDLNP